MNKILFGLFSLLALVSVAFAQEESVVNKDDFNSLYVSNIITNDESFSPGKKIDGTFELTNISNYVISGAKYRVELVQIKEDSMSYDYGDGESNASIDFDHFTEAFAYSNVNGPLNVPSGSLSVPFSYKIPENIPQGRIGLLIQLYTSNNLESNSDYVEINVSGDRVAYVAVQGNILVKSENQKDEQVFSAQEGPFVNEKDTVTLETLIINDSGESLTLTPEMKIFKGNNSSGELVYTNKFSNLNISGEEARASYPLKLDLEPSVYTGVLDYVDSTGVSRTIPIEFRYIIEGIKPKIGQVSYNTTNLVDSNFLISVSYMDIPLSFRKNEDGTYKDKRVQQSVDLNKNSDLNNLTDTSVSFLDNLSAVVRVKDLTSNSLLSSKNVIFNQSIETVADMGMISGADQVIVEVDLYQNGELIDSYTDTVEVETYQYKNIFDKIWNKYGKIVSMLALLILVAIIIALIKKSKVNKNIALSSIVALVLIGSSLALTKDANAVSTTGFKVENSYISSLIVSSPKPPSVEAYEPGDVIRFTGDLKFTYCTNSGYDLNARMSRPVLQGLPHANMGPWIGLPKKKFLKTTWDKKHVQYASSVNFPLVAPNQPGIYKFKYDMVARSGDWGDYETGTVTFRVAKDVCKNIKGVQDKVPRGHVAAVNANKQPICNKQETTSTLQCSASKNRLDVGESVTYTSRTVSGGKANFNWYKGREFHSGNLVKTQNNTAVSTYTTSYSTPGIYHTTAVAFVGGQSQQCTIIVSVGDEFNDDPLEDEELSDEEFLEDEYYTDEDGNKFLLDRTAPPGTIKFNMENLLTNTTCSGDWVATNVLKCGMYKNNVKVKDVEFTGKEDFGAGTYQIKCIQKRDGTEIKSEIRTCRLNPDVREF